MKSVLARSTISNYRAEQERFAEHLGLDVTSALEAARREPMLASQWIGDLPPRRRAVARAALRREPMPPREHTEPKAAVRLLAGLAKLLRDETPQGRRDAGILAVALGRPEFDSRQYHRLDVEGLCFQFVFLDQLWRRWARPVEPLPLRDLFALAHRRLGCSLAAAREIVEQIGGAEKGDGRMVRPSKGPVEAGREILRDGQSIIHTAIPQAQ